MHPRSCLFALCLILFASPLAAQSRFPLSLQGSGAVVVPLTSTNIDGSTGGSLPASIGFDLQGRYTGPGVLSVGVGFQWSNIGDYEGSILTVFYVEPRLQIRVRGPNLAPYLTARVGAGTTRYFSLSDPGTELTESSASVGAGAGLLISLNRRLGLDLGVLISSSRQPVGAYTLLRAGLNIGVGRPRGL